MNPFRKFWSYFGQLISIPEWKLKQKYLYRVDQHSKLHFWLNVQFSSPIFDELYTIGQNFCPWSNYYLAVKFSTQNLTYLWKKCGHQYELFLPNLQEVDLKNKRIVRKNKTKETLVMSTDRESIIPDLSLVKPMLPIGPLTNFSSRCLS